MKLGRRALGVCVLSLLATALVWGQPVPSSSPKEQFANIVDANFGSWDANDNGILEDAELARAVQDPKMTGDAAAAAATLKSVLKNKKAPKFPDWTRDFFHGEDPSVDFLVRGYRSARARLANASSELLVEENLTLPQCKQGSLGDCYLVAATGAAINRDPGVIRKMIRLDSDLANYVVTYPDGAEVKVPALTQGELAMGGAGTRSGLWLRILEKAWGVRRITGSKRLNPNAEPIDVMGYGGSIRTTFEAMSGHPVKSYRLGNSRGANVTIDELRTAIQEALGAHRLIGASTPTKVEVPGINGNHAYAVLGFDAKTDEIQVWNPHVNRFKPKDTPGLKAGYPTSEGMFSMPLADFIATFGGISIETEQAKPSRS